MSRLKTRQKVPGRPYKKWNDPPTAPPSPVLLKLACLAVHVEEARADGGHLVDWMTIDSLLNDPDVRAFLDDPANIVLLPRKRSAK